MANFTFVNEETIIKQYEISNEESKITIYLTDKRLYDFETNEDATNNSIIELDSIDSIEIDQTEHKKNITLGIILATIFAIAGIMIAVLSKEYLWFILSGVGAIILFVSLLLGVSRYTLDLLVHSKGITHYINVSFLSPQQLEELQKAILFTKDNLKK